MTISDKELDNILRWDGEKRGHYEVYYLKWNDFESQTACWIRYTMTSLLPHVGDPYCELWGIFFDAADSGKNFAVKSRYPIDKLAWDNDRFRVAVADAELTMNACRGAITDEAKGFSLAWDVTFDSSTPAFYYFPPEVIDNPAIKTKAISPHSDAHFSGTVTANGRKIKFSDAPGQQTHIWGAKHGLRWAWGHCNAFREDPDAVWEGIDGQVKLGPLSSPHFMIFRLNTGGREYRFNALSQLSQHHSVWKLGHWTFDLRNKEARVRGQITSRIEDLMAVTYTDPDGELLWCNNSKVSSIWFTLYRSDGSTVGEFSSERGCAVEFVDRKIYPEVPVRI